MIIPVKMTKVNTIQQHHSGADPGFKVKGGALQKIAPSGGRHENVWGISCEISEFFPILRGGGRAPSVPPPWIRPCH